MRTQAHITRAGRFIALFAVLCASLWTVQGAVLCIAPDGSLAVEAAGPDGACLTRPPEAMGHAAQIAEDCPHSASECAGCTDLALDRLPAGIHDRADLRRLVPDPNTGVVADAADVSPKPATAPADFSLRRTRLTSPETPLHLASTVLQR